MRSPFVISGLLHAGLLTVAIVGNGGERAPRPPFVAHVLDVPACPAVAEPHREQLPVAEVEPPVVVETEVLVPLPELDFEPAAEPVAETPAPATAVVEPVRRAEPDWRLVLPRPRDPAPAVIAVVAESPAPPAPPPEPAGAEASRTLTIEPGSNVPPNYPPTARRRRWQGTVLLRVGCGADGVVATVEVVRSSGHAVLDAAALHAVRRWRFAGGPGWLEVPIEFRLAGA